MTTTILASSGYLNNPTRSIEQARQHRDDGRLMVELVHYGKVEWAGSLAQFFDANAEGLEGDGHNLNQIRETLHGGGAYSAGGGAVPPWNLRPHVSRVA